MKHFINIAILLFMGFTTACSADDEETSNNKDVFYAKYAVTFLAEQGAFGSTPKIVNIYYNGGTVSSQKKVKKYSWEGDYGPLYKGSEIFLRVSSTSGTTTRGTSDYINTTISLKKNNGSYTIVKNGNSDISYKIK